MTLVLSRACIRYDQWWDRRTRTQCYLIGMGFGLLIGALATSGICA